MTAEIEESRVTRNTGSLRETALFLYLKTVCCLEWHFDVYGSCSLCLLKYDTLSEWPKQHLQMPLYSKANFQMPFYSSQDASSHSSASISQETAGRSIFSPFSYPFIVAFHTAGTRSQPLPGKCKTPTLNNMRTQWACAFSSAANSGCRAASTYTLRRTQNLLVNTGTLFLPFNPWTRTLRSINETRCAAGWF